MSRATTLFFAYLTLIGGVWTLFAFPDRLLRDEVLRKVAALVVPLGARQGFRRLFETIIAVGDSVFGFRPVRSGLLFLPSVSRLTLVYVVLSLTLVGYFSIGFLENKPLKAFLTTDLPLLVIIPAATFVFAFPLEYVSAVFTRVVLDEMEKSESRLRIVLYFISDIVFKVTAILALHSIFTWLIPSIAKSIIRTWVWFSPTTQRFPWFVTASLELSVGGYLSGYYLWIATASMLVLLIWGGLFTVAVFALSGLSRQPIIFKLIWRYINVQRRPFSLVGFFIILAVTPIYAVVSIALLLFAR